MVESTYAGDSPRSRSPMTEPSSPLRNSGPGFSGYGHRYLYNYSPETLQQKLKNIECVQHQHHSPKGHREVEGAREKNNYSRSSASPVSPEDTRYRPRESSRGASSSTVMTSPTSLFTIDSILAPRPQGNIVGAGSNTSSISILQQRPESVGSPPRTTVVHPLQQQLHHLAFTPADFLGMFVWEKTNSFGNTWRRFLK